MSSSGNFLPLTALRSTGVSSLRRLSHYDFILLIIPLSFLFSYLGSNVGGVSVETAFAFGATVGVLTVLDALFVHAPTAPDN